MQVNREALASKLQHLNCSQQTIESVAAWCVFYRKDAKNVVAAWEEEFHKAPGDRKLALLYLCNHVLQESKKKGKEFSEEFVKVLPRAVRGILSHASDKTRKSVERVVSVWEERRVFSSKEMRHIKDALQAQERLPRQESISGDDRKKMQLVGNLGDVLIAIDNCAKKTQDASTKSLVSFRQDLEFSSLQDLTSGQEALSQYSQALQNELQSRKKALSMLRSMVSQQEDALVRLERQVSVCTAQQKKLEDRMSQLQPPPTYAHSYMDTVPILPANPVVYQSMSSANPLPQLSSAALQQVAAALPALSNLAGWNGFATQAPPAGPTMGAPAGQPAAPMAFDPSSFSFPAPVAGLSNDPRLAPGLQTLPAMKEESVLPELKEDHSENAEMDIGELYDPDGPVRSEGDNVDLADVAAQLANSEQSAALLAQALACLPPEERDKFGMGVAEVLHGVGGGDELQGGEEDDYDPTNPY